MNKVFFACILLLILPACDGADEGSGGSAGSIGQGGQGGQGGGSVEGLSVAFAPVTVAPGEEHTRCVVKRLSNQAPIHVNRIQNTLGPGSHHLIVYRSGETEEQAEPFDCVPFTNLLNPEQGIPLMITQKPDDTLVLPDGVGFAFEQGQMIRLEMHYINYTSEPIEIAASSTFYPMEESAFQAQADFAMFANGAVDIPPQSEVTTDPLFLPLPDPLASAKFFALTGHQHRLGTGVRIATAETEAGADTVLYNPESFAWAEPPTEYFDPPIEVAPGGGFRLQCSWKNTTSDQVTFGESANDEMCLFYTYYYPSQGAIACAYTDLINGGVTFCCPGDPICAMLP